MQDSLKARGECLPILAEKSYLNLKKSQTLLPLLTVVLRELYKALKPKQGSLPSPTSSSSYLPYLNTIFDT
jgi:hypothetical protein